MAMWPSWPQAWQTPGIWDWYGWPHSSSMGSASMSARTATVRPGRAPFMSATTPVPAAVAGARPSAVSSATIFSWVLNSFLDNSG